MSVPPVSFTGISKFSDSFQTVLERTFTAASIPIQQLQTTQTILLSQQTELASLEADLQALQQNFSSLGILGAAGAVTASSSDAKVATVTVTGTPQPLSFDINVTSAAAKAQETTTSGLADTVTTPLAADGIFSLTVGTTTTAIDLLTIGSGRTAGTTGAATPAPKVSVQVDFSNGLTGSISAQLESFFVAAAAPSGAGAGDTVAVTFLSTNSSINETITTAALVGGETAAALALALNTAIAANANLNGKVSFSDEGGKLKLVAADTAGVGFTFTSSSTGTVVSGLEGGGTIGGHSAAEIAAALNTQVALDSTLVAAGVSFSAVNGEVRAIGSQAFDITGTDTAQGTGFLSGLAGTQTVAGFDNDLAGLRDFINAKQLSVSASIINTSSDPSNPEFHLTISADQSGATTLTLKDSAAADLLTVSNQGSDAVFTVNGLAVTNSSNTITDFAPGLSLTIVAAGQTTVAATDDQAGVSATLATLAVNYNAVVARIGTQIGENAGTLSGNILVREAQSVLREITGFAGSGTVKSISDLGLTLDDKGQMSFDSVTLQSLAVSDFAGIRTFLGDTTTGFAGTAFSRLKDISDPVIGQIQTAIDLLQESDARFSTRVLEAQERVDKLIETLEAQFAAADTLLAQLESQQELLKRLFEVQFFNNNDN